jgi:hypothetical protein
MRLLRPPGGATGAAGHNGPRHLVCRQRHSLGGVAIAGRRLAEFASLLRLIVDAAGAQDSCTETI